jgi:hypothetical protein
LKASKREVHLEMIALMIKYCLTKYGTFKKIDLF